MPRKIHVDKITKTVEELCIKACVVVPCDIRRFMEDAVEKEEGLGKQIL